MIDDRQRAKRELDLCETPFVDCPATATTIVSKVADPLDNYRCCPRHAASFGGRDRLGRPLYHKKPLRPRR